MPAMGKLTGDERYVVTVEILGPKSPADAEKINAALDELKRNFGASMKFSIVGFKATAGRPG
jgi:hypothetical protein